MKNKNENILVCTTAQLLDFLAEEKRLNVGYVKGGRELLNNQEHIFVDNLVDCEKTIYNDLSTEKKLELYKQKYSHN